MATTDDATVLLQLLQWGASTGLDDAMRHVFSEDFDVKATPGSMNIDPSARTVLAFFETAGALVKHGTLDIALLHDIYWIAGVWERVSGHALNIRATANEPRMYEHFEAIAKYAG